MTTLNPHTSQPTRVLGSVRPRPQGGFTIVELLVVVTVIALLAAIAVPNMRSALMRARAAEAVGDLQVVRVAAFTYLADRNEWPPDAQTGQVPPGMAEYLPEGWTMVKEGFVMNWDNWAEVGPLDFIAVTVEVDDPEFGSYIVDMLGPNAWTNGGVKFTWVIEWLE